MGSKHLDVKIARETWKKLKNENKAVFSQQKDVIIKAFVNSPLPEWGSITFNILK